MGDFWDVDPNDYVDYEYVKSIIDKNSDKEIYFFGTGAITEYLLQVPDVSDKIVGLLDNNKKIHGTFKYGLEVFNPEILKEKKANSILVMITSMYYEEIGEQLNEYGLRSDWDYIEVNTLFITYVRIRDFAQDGKNLCRQLDAIPKGGRPKIEIDNKPIGIVCSACFEQIRTWFAIEQCLLLRYSGYESVCIIDALKGFDDYIEYDKTTEIALKYINYVLDKIKKICPDFRVIYLDNKIKCSEISEQESEKCEQYVYEIMKWYASRKEYVKWNNNEKRNEIAEDILKRNLKYIKQFFKDNYFETVFVSTGAHKHRCLYKLVADEFDFRLVTCDGGEVNPDRVSYTTRGISSHHKDVARIINEDWFTTEEKDIFFEMAKKEFEKRIIGINKDDEYYYQIVKMKKIDKPYDVIMPLNISWDAAALFQNKLFRNDLEWIFETVEYIMNNTNCNVMIREHPCKNKLKEYGHPDLSIQLKKMEEYGDRVRICYAEEEINTYSYLNECKLVLPYSSTVGLEAIALGKKALIHTDCYYSGIGISQDIKTKQEYFDSISYYLYNEYSITDEQKRKAILTLFYVKNDYLHTYFNEGMREWLSYSWNEMLMLDGVKKIKEILINNTPVLYYNLKEMLNEKKI